MGRMSKAKGSAFERQVAKILGDAYDIELRRTPLSGGWAKEFDGVAGDLVSIDKEYDLSFCVECKKQEGWRLESLLTDDHTWFDNWWEQATKAGKLSDKPPLLVFSRNRTPIFAASTMDVMQGIPFPYMMLKVGEEQVVVTTLDNFLLWDLMKV